MLRSKILFLTTGSIASFKACEVVSALVKKNFNVQVVATAGALQFVGAATWEGLTGQPVAHELWQNGKAMDHIHLIREADLIIVAPATANFINQMAAGLANDLASTIFLAHDFQKPFLVAPAMNTMMYQHPTTQNSLRLLRKIGLTILETEKGTLACGEFGEGRLLSPELIVQEIESQLLQTRDLKKHHVLVTAGGTKEFIDDVRAITNTSTGKSGVALAQNFSRRGAQVTLLKSKSAPQMNGPQVRTLEFESFSDLQKLLKSELESTHFTHVVHLAAVSDYSVEGLYIDGKKIEGHKLSSSYEAPVVKLKKNPKLIDDIKNWSLNKNVKVVGFKLTSHASDEEQFLAAQKVLQSADLVVSNDLKTIRDEEQIHPYQIFSKNKRPLKIENFEELSEHLTKWVQHDSLS